MPTIPIVFSFMPCQNCRDFVLHYYLLLLRALLMNHKNISLCFLIACLVIVLCIIYTLQHNSGRNDRIMSFLIRTLVLKLMLHVFCSFLVTRDIFPISRSNNIERWKKGRSLQKKNLTQDSESSKEEGRRPKKSFKPLLGHFLNHYYFSAVGW